MRGHEGGKRHATLPADYRAAAASMPSAQPVEVPRSRTSGKRGETIPLGPGIQTLWRLGYSTKIGMEPGVVKQSGGRGAIPGLELEQVAELEEETVFGRLQVGAAQWIGIGQGAAISGEEYRARIGLIGEQQVPPKRPVAVRTGSKILVDLRVEDENRRVGSRLVPERTPPLSGVLPHQPEKDRTGELVFDLESRAPPDIDRAAIAAPPDVLHLVIAVDPEPVGWPPVERELEPGDLGTGPLVEVLVVSPEEEHVGGEVGELRGIQAQHIVEIRNRRLAGECDRIDTGAGGKRECVALIDIGRIAERLVEDRGAELPSSLE